MLYLSKKPARGHCVQTFRCMTVAAFSLYTTIVLIH